MKAEVIRDDIELSAPPEQRSAEWMEITVIRKVKRNSRMIERAFWKVGAVIDLPDCWMAVAQGWAVPADDECREKCGMTPDEMAAAQKAYERVSRGIHPEDYARFDAGEILGYQPNGEYVRGPNWKDEPEDEDDDES